MNEVESRALRRAVVVLLTLSVVRWVGARSGPVGDPDPPEDVGSELVAAAREAAQRAAARSRPLAEGERIDPNRADEVALDRLPGVGPSIAAAIVSARADGTVFRRPEDLAAVRGIGPALVRRIGPYLDLGAPPPGRRVRRRPPDPRSTVSASVVDLNRAGVDALRSLPGIGPAIARRIVEERGKRMFTSLDDLARVRGVGPATIERLRGRARAGSGDR